VALREALEGRLPDWRKPRGKRHPLVSLISALVAGVAAACTGPLAVAQAAAGWDQEVLAAHGCWRSPRTGLLAAPSASTLDRLPKLLDPDELEAALTAAATAVALDPAIPAAYAAHRARQRREQEERRKNRKRKPPAATAFREDREDGWFRPHPLHPWLGPAACGDPGHVPARHGVAVDGKERKGAKKGQWRTSAEAVLYITSLGPDEATLEDLLAHVRGHWRVEHTHWLRDVIWKEDKSLIRTGNGPQVWSALANLVITLFHIHGVTSYTAETRRIAQNPRRALRFLGITSPSPG
jgi:predicted transposase YbfD/YdcC